MGDDFIAEHKDRYNRSLTNNLQRGHGQRPLFRPRVKETVSYPCHLKEASQFPVQGRRLTLRLSETSVELIDAHQVIGFVSPEANQDVIDDFKANPDCKGILTVVVAGIFQEANRIDVTPSSETDGGGN